MSDDLRSRMLAAMKPTKSASSISNNAKARLHGYSLDFAKENAVTPASHYNRDFINKIKDVTVLPGFSANIASQPEKGCVATVGPEAGCKVEIIELPQAERYRKVFAYLQLRPPAFVESPRWKQCVADGSRFLAVWGEQAQALNWTSADLFGLHDPPANPHPNYNRLSRYDCTGLVWLLQGRKVTALTADTAAIQNPTTGNVTVYRRHNKPGLGPLGDSLEDLK